MSSLRQIAVNRANARHSTGPRTEEGKRISALNAVRHGLTGRAILLSPEDGPVYQGFVQTWFDHYQPQGPMEEHLCQSIVDACWRIHHIRSLENNLLVVETAHHADHEEADPEVATAIAAAKALPDVLNELDKLS